tara:strand:+ start:51 stop:437 length:387 start_codon:yes stop_codon:yes gene_type:complete
MAIPSAGGSEILQRGWFPALSNSEVYAVFTGAISSTSTSNAVPAHNIISMLSMTFNERAGSSTELIKLRVIFGGSSSTFVFAEQSIPAYGTFIWNEPLVLHATDKLVFGANTAANIDVQFYFIRQDWS